MLSPFALMINWRSEPCPASFLFTTTLKLYPKSTPVMFADPRVTVVMLCGAVVAVVSAPSVVEPLPASTLPGTWPPT